MSNDAEYRPRRAALPSDEETPEQGTRPEGDSSTDSQAGTPRRGWSGDDTPAEADSPAAADESGANETPEDAHPGPAFSRGDVVAREEQTPEQPAAEPAERPENPFAPKADSRERKGILGRKQQPAEETPVGRRAAEPKPKRRFDRRNTTALTIAGISAVCVVAVLVSYALWFLNRPSPQTAPAAAVAATPGPVLSQAGLLTDGMAKEIDPSRTWTQGLTQDGVNDSSPGAACINPQPSGQPSPQITELRQIGASGNDKTAALHRADAYATPEEAAQMFNFRSTEIGGCVDSPLYVEKGMQITGIGNQAVGVRLVLQDKVNEYHSIALVRTGRVLNILDVARQGKPVEMDGMVKALTQVVNRQCGPAVGLCTAPNTSVSITIPPPGGDQPGLLASGDIPRVTPGVGQWKGNAPAARIELQDGTGCEAVDFATVSGAEKRQQRTYLLRNDPQAPPQFGIDQLVLQMENPGAAGELVDKVSNNIRGCESRVLTAKVTKQATLETPAQGTTVKGNWYIVTQKLDQTKTQKYRVGIFSAGQKVIYLRANPSDTFDFSDESWIGVNLRAGERATQVR